MSRRWFLPIILIILSLISLALVRTLAPELLMKQAMIIFGCSGLFVFCSLIPFKKWLEQANKLYFFSCFSLVLPLLLNQQTRDTARWIKFGTFFQLQPSQLAFPLIGLALIVWLVKHPPNRLFNQLRAWLLIILPGLLIVIEPNLSTTLFFFSVMGILIFLAGLPIKHLLIIAVACVSFGLLGWQTWLRPYQRERIVSFIDAQKASADQNYNAQQALIAVGAGGWWGQGWGSGSQSKLAFLPEKHTDFIFAAFAEQFGLIGSIILLAIYISLVIFLWKQASYLHQPAAKLFLYLVATMLAIQTFIAVGTNIGLLPITGLTLPILSTGGSSLLTYSLCFGITQNLIKTIRNPAQTFLV